MALASRSAAEHSPARHETGEPPSLGEDMLSAPAIIKTDPNPAFAVGERVSYWSETHQQWMNAIVKQAHADGQGGVSYDLDVKRGAQASKIRRLSNPPPLSQLGHDVAWQGHGVEQQLLANKTENGDSEECSNVFAAGDHVEYWSDTYQQWMPAEVKKVRDGGEAYDLSVKRGAQRHRIRPLQSSSSIAIDSSAHAAAVATASSPPIVVAGESGMNAVSLAVAPVPETMLSATGPSSSEVDPVPETADNLRRPSDNVPRTVFAGLQPLPENFDESSKRSVPRVAAPTLVAKASGSPPYSSLVPATKPTWISSQSAGNYSDAAQGRRSLSGAVGTQPPSPRGLSPVAPRACPAAQVRSSSVQEANVPADNGAVASSARGELRPTLLPLTTNVEGATAAMRPAPGSTATVIAASQPQQHRSSSGGGLVPLHSPEVANGTPTAATVLPAPGGYPSANPIVNRSAKDTASDGSMSLKVANGIRTTPHSGAAARQTHRISEGGSAARSITYFMGTGLEFRRPQQLQQQQQLQQPDVAGYSPATSSRPNQLTSITPTASSSVSSSFGVPLELRELRVPGGQFTPVHASVHSQLVQHLGLSSSASVEEMQGFRGGLNEGVWFLTDTRRNGSREELVLKLVRGHRITPTILTEAENFLRMSQEHPGIIQDPSVAFPCKIFNCVGEGTNKQQDLIVMRKVQGSRLAELIAHKWYGNQAAELMHIFSRVGEVLCDFHCRYNNAQHGDFQPSNIFYDEDRGEVTMIDVGGMGVPTTDTDVQHFSKSLKMLADAYGNQLATDGLRSFEQGYAKGGASGRGASG